MFNLEQLEELEKVFAKQHNIVGKKRAQLAAQLNLTENQVRAGTPVGLGLHPGTVTTLSENPGSGLGGIYGPLSLCQADRAYRP